jgi:iron complex transport system ATP-binding protein
MMMSVSNLRVVRRGRVLLDDVSFGIRAGEVVALIGPNGAGKTTLLTALVGLIQADAGSITIDGKPLACFTSRRRAQLIAYLAQKQDFLWDLEVAEVIGLGAASTSDAARTIDHLRLAALTDRRIKTLSGGERSRVMLARALAGNTPLLFADEPAADLDVRQQRTAMRHLRQEARDRALGVLVVLHDLNLAFAFADRVLLLDHGRLVADAPSETVAQSPELDSVFGERFLRSSVAGRTAVLPLDGMP